MRNKDSNLLITAAPVTLVGGTIKRLNIWAENLCKRNKATLLYWAPAPRQAEKMIASGSAPSRLQLCYSRTLNRPGRILLVPAICRIIFQLLKQKPNYVISMFLWSGLATGIAINILRALRIADIKHGMYLAGDICPASHSNSSRTLLYSLASKICLHLADETIAISQHTLDINTKKYGINSQRKTHIVPISVHNSHIHHSPKKNSGTFTFCIISRLVAVKGVHHVIRAFHNICTKDDHIRLEIYGEGKEKTRLIELARSLKLKDKIRFHGWTDSPLQRMSRSNCLVLHSKIEGTPRSILEAASIGIPTIATNVGGIPDIILDGQTGWLVPYQDEQQLARTMSYVINNPDQLRRVGNAARQYTLSKHSADKETAALSRIIFGD